MKAAPRRLFRIPAGMLWLVATCLAAPNPAAAQALQPTIVVGGNPLVTARPATRIGEEWFLPLIPIAEALGIEVEVDPGSLTLRARRRDGTQVVYDGRTGEIRLGHVHVGRLEDHRQISLAVPRDDLLFPLSGVVALLGVEIQEDRAHAALRIEPAGSGARAAPAALSVSTLGYDYGFTTNTDDYSQFVALHGTGLAQAARLKGNLLLSRYPGQSGLNFSQGTLQAEFPGRRRLLLGDQAVYSGLEALGDAVRGAGMQLPLAGYDAHFYGGRSMSAAFASLGGGFSRYDAGIAGFALRRKTAARDLSFGGHYFDGEERRGAAAGVSYGRSDAGNQFASQIVLGRFSGRSTRSADEPIPVDGPALGLTVTDTYMPVRRLSVSGRFDSYGRNFLTPRADPRFQGQTAAAFSAVFRPNTSVSLTAGVHRRTYLVGNRGGLGGYNLGAHAVLPRRHPLQFGFFRSVQGDPAAPGVKTSLTQVSLALPQSGRYSAYAHYTAMGFAGTRAHELDGVLAVDFRDRGRLVVHDHVQFGGRHRLGADWYLDMPRRGGFIRAGIDRAAVPGERAGFYPLVGFRVRLPHGHSLQLTYLSDRGNRTFRVEIGGSLVREPEFAGRTTPDTLVRPARVTGRAYLDRDLDGTFSGGTDRPVADIPVFLDGVHVASTDAQGMFCVEGVIPGAHTLRAGLEGVPADMVFAGPAEKTVAVLPFRDNVLDFRLVRTGRIGGRISYLDYGGDPEAPVERPLPDARILAGSEHDAYSEANGRFMLGDLPPGTYELRLDPETLPPGYEPRLPALAVIVAPGETVQGADFLLVVPPKPIVEKSLPPMVATQPEIPAAQAAAPRASGTDEKQAEPHAPALPAVERKAPPRPAAFEIQVFSSRVRKEAQERAEQLRRAGYSPIVRRARIGNGELWYRVRLAGFDSRASAAAAGEALIAKKLAESYWVIP
jgi:hypothetical protein